MIYALIDNDVVANIVQAQSINDVPGKLLLESKPWTQVGDRLTTDGRLPDEIWAWSKSTKEKVRFTETDQPTDAYTTTPPPAYATGWDGVTNAWIVDTAKELADAKTAKKAAIDANTNRIKLRDGLVYSGKHFSMTDAAKLNWTGMLAASSILPVPMTILTMDDTPHVLNTRQDLTDFLMAVMAYDTAPGSPLTSGRILRMRVEAAQTVDEVNAIIDDRE